MSDGNMFGRCEVCGKEGHLQRTYFRLPIKCDCHSPEHFDLVDHCPECMPVRPTTKITLKMEQAEALERKICETNALRAENARLNQWISDLQSGMYVNCVYCGHRYGPGETTPVSMADALKEHVQHCPKHPMSALKTENARLTAELEAAKTRITPEARMAYDFQCRDNARLQGELHAARKELEAAKQERDALIASIRGNNVCLTCRHHLKDGCSAIRNGWRCRYVHLSECGAQESGQCAENGGTHDT